MMNKSQKDINIDIIRVVGLSWVVMVHAILSMNYSLFADFYQIMITLFLIEMPIMFFVAGAANYKSRATSVKQFYQARLRRIIIPYIAYLLFAVIVTIFISYVLRDNYGRNVFRLTAWYNLLVNGLVFPNSSYLMYALWFVPVYLVVMLVVPWLRQWHMNSVKREDTWRYIILGLLVGVFLTLSCAKLKFLTNVSFYLIWTYVGFFYDKLDFKSTKGKWKNLLLGLFILSVMLFIHRADLSVMNMQVNKFPPNYKFLLYSLAGMNILYFCSSWLIKTIKSLIDRSARFAKYFTCYNKYGYTIYLYHMTSLMLIDALLFTFDPKIFLGKYPIIRAAIFFVLVMLINPMWAKLFGWIEELQINFKISNLNWAKVRSSFKRLFFKLYHLVVLVVLGLGAHILLAERAGGLFKLAGFLAAIGLLLLVSYLARRLQLKIGGQWDIVALILLTVALRLVFVLISKTEQFSDYQNYFNSATMLASGDFSNLNLVKYITIFKHILGYASFLAGGFMLFGSKAIVGQLANVVLAGVSVWLLYKITQHFFSRKTALLAGLAYAVFPSNILFSPLLFQGYLTTTLLLMALYFYFCRPSKYQYFWLGFVLGLMEITRPLAIVMVIAIVLYESVIRAQLSKTNWKNLAMMVLVFLSIPVGFYKLMSYQLKSQTAGLSYFTLFVGISDEGHWTIEDSNVMAYHMFEPITPSQHYQYDQARLRPEVMADNGAQIVQDRMKQEFLQRAKQKDFNLNFIFNKIRFMWSGDETALHVPQRAAVLNKHHNKLLYVTNLYYWLSLICMVIIVGYGLFTERSNELLSLTILFVAGFVALHLITEVAFRYHFMLTPLFALAMSMIMTGEYKNKKIVKPLDF